MLTPPKEADHRTVTDTLCRLQAAYPCLHPLSLGCSVVGRELRALSLGDGPDNVVIAAGVHGQEWITALVALRLCEEIAAAWTADRCINGLSIRRAGMGRRLVFWPTVNPDGIEIALHGAASAGEFATAVRRWGGDCPGRWQANARGVDLNHNFPAGWEWLHRQEAEAGITGPAPRQWGGPHPASEPETRAAMRLCRRMRPRHIIALHTQGEEIYWHYTDRTPKRAWLMARVMADASGYRVAQPTGLASHGGLKDWFIAETGRPGFTLELGRGHNPLPLSDFEPLYAKAREMLLLAVFM